MGGVFVFRPCLCKLDCSGLTGLEFLGLAGELLFSGV